MLPVLERSVVVAELAAAGEEGGPVPRRPSEQPGQARRGHTSASLAGMGGVGEIHHLCSTGGVGELRHLHPASPPERDAKGRDTSTVTRSMPCATGIFRASAYPIGARIASPTARAWEPCRRTSLPPRRHCSAAGVFGFWNDDQTRQYSATELGEERGRPRRSRIVDEGEEHRGRAKC